MERQKDLTLSFLDGVSEVPCNTFPCMSLARTWSHGYRWLQEQQGYVVFIQ